MASYKVALTENMLIALIDIETRFFVHEDHWSPAREHRTIAALERRGLTHTRNGLRLTPKGQKYLKVAYEEVPVAERRQRRSERKAA